MRILPPQFAISIECDLEEGIWSFKMEQPFECASGKFVIVDASEYEKIKEALENYEIIKKTFTYGKNY